MEDRKVILVVDDQEDALMYSSHVLRSAGYWVRTARNVSECLRSIRSRRPDVILMDVNMPQEGGLLATVKVREEAGRNIPVILHTGMPTERIRPLMAEVGASDLIRKGGDPDELLKIVARWMGQTARRSVGAA